MSAITFVHRQVIPASYALLPEAMGKPEATHMLLAIGLQESRFEYRRQIGGPARGFWQFENGGGFRGVLNHHSSKETANNLLQMLAYPTPEFESLAHNDILACCFARLLLWTDAHALPASGEPDAAWAYYIRNWRPGKPHPETWGAFWTQAGAEAGKA